MRGVQILTRPAGQGHGDDGETEEELLEKYGFNIVYTDDIAPAQEPGPDQLLLRVNCCGLDDRVFESCKAKCYAPNTPFVPGWDIVGVVEKCGERVQGFNVGDMVAGIIPYDQQGGGCAEFVVVPQDCVLPYATSLDPAKLCTVLCGGLLAYTAVHKKMRVRKGDTVLVLGPTSVVGCLVVQLVALLGGYTLLYGLDGAETKQLTDHFESTFTTLLNDCTDRKTLGDLVLTKTNGLGVDHIVDARDSKQVSSAEQEQSLRRQLLSCLGVHGNWVTRRTHFQLDPRESEQLYFRGGSLHFLSHHAWSLAGKNKGIQLHMLQDLILKLESGELDLPSTCAAERFQMAHIQYALQAIRSKSHAVVYW